MKEEDWGNIRSECLQAGHSMKEMRHKSRGTMKAGEERTKCRRRTKCREGKPRKVRAQDKGEVDRGRTSMSER